MSRLLEIEQLSVDFHTPKGSINAIRDITLSINAGETVCLVGESGSGKTVTSKAIMRLIDHENGQITKGRLLLDGTDIVTLPEHELREFRGKKMAMVFQEPMSAFDPVFTIGHQIQETIIEHDKVSKREAKDRVIQLLKKVGIPDPEQRYRQYPGEMSGGMLQRAMIAMSLSCQPDLLIADEPTTALDVTIQAQILQLLQELQEEYGLSILLITHDLGIAAEIADRIVVMYAGEVVEEASADDLFALPGHPYTRGLLRSIPTLDSVRGSKLYSIKGSIPSLNSLPDGCRFQTRCPFATEHCKQEAPPLAEYGDRKIACWRSDELVRSDFWLNGSEVSVEPEPSNLSVVMSESKDTKALFTVHHLRKYYPLQGSGLVRGHKVIRAVDDVSFSINKHETFGLVGESGSGKSTLGRVLLQLERATQGTVTFDGQDLTKLKGTALRSVRQHMQTIFQDPYGSFDPRWKIGDSIAEPLKVHQKLKGADLHSRIHELLELVGLDPAWSERYPHEFSGGQRQRIGIARAIALNPKFILADEAVSALDVSVQAQIINLLQELQGKLGLTYMFIAHGLQVVRHISDRIGVMYLGKLVEIAPSESLFLQPAHPYTQALIKSVPQISRGREERSYHLQGEIPSPSSPPSGCRFHTRCPFVTSRCREEEPQLRQLASGHLAACHFPL